jgi:tetratricopeptide (TPR) repeat protein
MTAQATSYRWMLVAAWLLITLCASAQTATPPQATPSNPAGVRLQSYLNEAAEALHKGDLTSAADALRRALAVDPHSLAALNNMGIVLAREGKPAEAIPLYQEALRLRPGDPATKRNLAVAYFKAQRYQSAWSLLQSMAVAYPSDFQILDLAGLSLFALDHYTEAARYLERANQADPSDLETLDMLGKAYLHIKDYKALTSVFARIMQVKPNSASAHILMATAYEEADNRPDAIKEYQAAEQADPDFAGVHSGLGYLYWLQGDYKLAESESREELRRFPNDPVSNCVLGQVLLANLELDEAETHLRLALKVNPVYEDALLGLGKTEIALKHPREAVEVIRKDVRLHPDSSKAHYMLSTALYQLGRTEEAARERKIAADLPEKMRQERIKKNQEQ